MLTKRPRTFHPGKTFRERLFHHRIACIALHGELIFGFSRHCFASIHRDMIELLKDTREALDLVPSGKWLEFEGGVISGSFNQPGPALSRRRRSRHDDG